MQVVSSHTDLHPPRPTSFSFIPLLVPLFSLSIPLPSSSSSTLFCSFLSMSLYPLFLSSSSPLSILPHPPSSSLHTSSFSSSSKQVFHSGSSCVRAPGQASTAVRKPSGKHPGLGCAQGEPPPVPGLAMERATGMLQDLGRLKQEMQALLQVGAAQVREHTLKTNRLLCACVCACSQICVYSVVHRLFGSMNSRIHTFQYQKIVFHRSNMVKPKIARRYSKTAVKNCAH